MSDIFTLRRLTVNDSEAFRDIRQEGLRLTPQAFTSALSEEEARPLEDVRQQMETNHVLGAWTHDGGLQAVMGLYLSDSPRTGHIGQVWGVYLRERARGTGLARRMLESLVDTARGRVEALDLGVGAYNTPARRLYSSVGFVELAHLPRVVRVDDVYYDEILMRLAFPPAQMP
jgi:RimJ/RimL family protein N-acetyltransferase